MRVTMVRRRLTMTIDPLELINSLKSFNNRLMLVRRRLAAGLLRTNILFPLFRRAVSPSCRCLLLDNAARGRLSARQLRLMLVRCLRTWRVVGAWDLFIPKNLFVLTMDTVSILSTLPLLRRHLSIDVRNCPFLYLL